MAPEERLTARQYDRWMRKRDPLAHCMRFAMTPAGAIFVNTPVFMVPRELGLRPDHRLLDLGCGQVSIARLLASMVPFRTPPVGVDVSPTMLRLGQHALRDGGWPPVELVQGPATTLPFADESFDVVVSAHMVKHLSDDSLRRCFAEVLRVLRPGGAFLLWEFTVTGSRLLNRLNHCVLTLEVKTARLRTFRQLALLGLECGFQRVLSLELRPFLLPPIPRISVLMGKAARWDSSSA